jgi:transposase
MEVPMGNYLIMADKQRILALIELGWSYRRIQRETGVHRDTVARYDPGRPPKPAKATAGSISKPAGVAPGSTSTCEPYREYINKALDQGLTAQRIWQDIREEYGFSHSYTSVKRFVRLLKKRRPEVAGVMEHTPGKEAQVDFFKGPPTLNPVDGCWHRPWILRVTLSCSRHGYEEAVWAQDRVHFLRAIEHAFIDFGGVPEVLRHDNLKAAIVRACLYDPDVSELYAAFARHWGFVPLPARPRHPQEDGIVENSNGYVKDNAVKGKRFDSLEELNAHLARWNRTIARLRIHGTTRKQVYAHFLEVEKPVLKPLAPESFNLFDIGTRTVHPDGHVQIGGSYYSVPHVLVGEDVRVQWDDRLLRVYARGKCVAVHTRAPVGTFATRNEHRPAHKPAKEEAYVAGLLSKAEHIGDNALDWSKAACEERGVRAYRLLQGMLSLTRNHPRERVDWACRVALERRLFRYKILRRLVEQSAAHNPIQVPELTQRHEIIRDLFEYAEEIRV